MGGVKITQPEAGSQRWRVYSYLDLRQCENLMIITTLIKIIIIELVEVNMWCSIH